eukprot:scaffold15683_cov71-Skeletonema_dohrnii-CCMP3373.AAC.2
MPQPVYKGLDSSAVKLKKRGKRTHTELKRLMGKFLPKNTKWDELGFYPYWYVRALVAPRTDPPPRTDWSSIRPYQQYQSMHVSQTWATKTLGNITLYPPERLKLFSARLACFYQAIAINIAQQCECDSALFKVNSVVEIAERYAGVKGMSAEELQDLDDNIRDRDARRRGAATTAGMRSDALDFWDSIVNLGMVEEDDHLHALEMISSYLSQNHANLVRPYMMQRAAYETWRELVRLGCVDKNDEGKSRELVGKLFSEDHAKLLTHFSLPHEMQKVAYKTWRELDSQGLVDKNDEAKSRELVGKLLSEDHAKQLSHFNLPHLRNVATFAETCANCSVRVATQVDMESLRVKAQEEEEDDHECSDDGDNIACCLVCDECAQAHLDELGWKFFMPISAFHEQSKRVAKSAYNAAYYDANRKEDPEKRAAKNEYSAAWRAKLKEEDPEKYRAAKAASREYSAAWRAKLKEDHVKWEKHLAYHSEYNAARRAKRKKIKLAKLVISSLDDNIGALYNAASVSSAVCWTGLSRGPINKALKGDGLLSLRDGTELYRIREAAPHENLAAGMTEAGEMNWHYSVDVPATWSSDCTDEDVMGALALLFT